MGFNLVYHNRVYLFLRQCGIGKNGFEPLRPSLRPGRSQLLALSE
nr:MAG TPA: hypothetical protein [Caudoviricetes sp.]